MKGNKRVITGILAAVMILSSSVVPESRAASNGGSNIPGSGSFEGTLSDVFRVQVPTLPDPDSVNENQEYKSPYDFIMDPRGLAQKGSLAGLQLEPGATVYFENAEEGARYDWSSTSDALTVINKGTVNVDVRLTAELTGLDDIKLAGDKSFPNDTGASIYLALADGAGKVAPIDRYGAAIKGTLKGQPDAYKVIWDSNLKKYRYELKENLEAANIKFNKYTFRLTGACNSANLWSNISGEIKPTISVTWVVSTRPQNVAPSIEKTLYAMNKGCAVLVGVDLGSGNLAAKGIGKITYSNSSGVATMLPSDKYTFENGVLRFRPSFISELIDAGIGSRTYTITFNDRDETQVRVTLATDDAGPSVDQTSYAMISGQPVLVGVDLGSGTLAATRIKSVTYINSSGATATLSTDYYTFETGILRIKPSYINSLLSGGFTSRTFMVIFDDKANTQATFTLAVDGVAPSVAQTSYIMETDKDVVIDVDLGSGSLMAEGIKSVTYKNSSGNTTVFSDSNYEYADGTLTIKGSFVNNLLSGGIMSREYTIIFDNAVGTKATVTLTAPDKAPSINGGSECPMVRDQAVFVDIDLGSGSVGATGIKSITYINSSGATATLSTDYYTFIDGVLRFKVSYINSLLDGGLLTRVFTITLNDKAGTSKTITFKADGNAPSIVGATTYTVSKDQAVLINLDLGTSSLEASGIRHITYQNSSGVTTALSTSNYTFENGVLRLKASFINTLANGNFTSREYTITFENPMKTRVKFTLKK